MSPYALLDPAVTAAHSLLTVLAEAMPGPTGAPAIAAAVVALTLLVRAALLPLAVRTLRAERARAALAPELERLRRRFGKDRDRLARETLAAYRRAGVGLFAGVGAALAQLPVVTTLYRVVTVPTVAGAPNILVGPSLLGAPLTAQWPQVLAGATFLSVPWAAFAVLIAALAALAVLSVRQQAARLTAAAQQPQAGAALLRLMPYGTVALAAVMPVAVGIYLLSSTAWTVAERAVLPRLM